MDGILSSQKLSLVPLIHILNMRDFHACLICQLHHEELKDSMFFIS